MLKKKMHFDGWDYPPPGLYSTLARDEEGYLRVKGQLLKKGGSKRGSAQDSRFLESLGLANRRNWSERWFWADLEAGTVYYYLDEHLRREAGLVKFVPGETIVHVPEEVRLRGRHAPRNEYDAVNYIELIHTSDDVGNIRQEPFAVRAKTTDEFEDWLRTFQWLSKNVLPAPKQDPPPSRPSSAKSIRKEVVEVKKEPVDEDDTDLRLSQADLLVMEFFYQDRDSGEPVGPVDLDGLRDAWKRGRVDKYSYVYPHTVEAWRTLDSIPMLLRLLAPPRPPPPKKSSSSVTQDADERQSEAVPPNDDEGATLPPPADDYHDAGGGAPPPPPGDHEGGTPAADAS